MISYSYKLFQYDNMYNLYTTICIIMITSYNSLIISIGYSYCITNIRISIVGRIILRFICLKIRMLYHNEMARVLQGVFSVSI